MADTAAPQRSRMVLMCVLFALLAVGICDEQVPVVIWSSEGTPLQSQTPPVAGHIVSSSQLVSYLQSALGTGPHNVLLFLQDKLSVDDFTMYGGVFGNKQDNAFTNLESALQSAPSSLVLPSVDWQASSAVPALLQEKLGISPLYLDPGTLSQLRLNDSLTSLLVIRLPYSTGTHLMSPREVLSGNDEVIGQVLNIMKTQAVQYTAVYTALRASRVIREVSLAVESLGRSLLQAAPSPQVTYPPVMYNTSSGPCILFWAQNMTMSQLIGTNQWVRVDLGPMTFGSSANVTLADSFCNRTNARLTLNYGNIQSYQNFKVIFSMSNNFYPVSAREWFTLDTMQIQYSGNQVATFNASGNIYAPQNYSFHCQSVTSFSYPLLVPKTANDLAVQWAVSFAEFQIQGFNVTGPSFSYASDCAGFFSPGIWMGLVTSLLMLLILTYGLHMIMQLKTMDRFDDPKGPSISVPQNE